MNVIKAVEFVLLMIYFWQVDLDDTEHELDDYTNLRIMLLITTGLCFFLGMSNRCQILKGSYFET